MASDNFIPDELDFNESDINEAAKDRVLAPTGENEYIRFKTTGQKRSVSERGTMQVVLTQSPLKDPDDGDSTTTPNVRDSLTLPIANKDVEGHQAPNTAGLCMRYYGAVGVEVPNFPRFDKETKTYTYNGEEIEKDEVEGSKKEAIRALMAQLKKDWEDTTSRIDDVFYARVVHNAQGFVNLADHCKELPEGATLREFKNWLLAAKSDEEGASTAPAKKSNGTANGHTNGSNGAAKPIAKAATKKPATKTAARARK